VDDLQFGYVLDLFNHRVGPRIQGFFDRTFWKRVVVQLGHSEPAIQSAMKAVCAVYEQVEAADGELASMDQASITAYNKAIQLIVSQTASSEVRSYVPIIVCVLFVCLEFLQGNQTAATTHIQGGISMLNDWRQLTVPEASSAASSRPKASSSSKSQGSRRASTSSEWELMETLTAVFSRLRLQSGVFGKSPIFRQISAEVITKTLFHFRTIAEARDANVKLMNDSIDFIAATSLAKYTNNATPDMAAQQRWLEAQFLEWRRAIEEFLKGGRKTMDEMEYKGAQLLMCHNTCCYIWTTTCLSPEESQYDKFKDQFEEMVDRCASIADLSPEFLCTHVGRFHFDMGLIAPLHLIGSRCRWPQIRKACLKVLASYRWREGLFDSYRSYRYIKTVMDLEEAEKIRLLGIEAFESEDYLPPEGARIHFAELGLVDPGSGCQNYTFFTKRFGPHGQWYMQTKAISTSSKNPLEDAAFGDESQSAYITSTLQKSPEVVPDDSSTKAFADRSNGIFYYHLVGPNISSPGLQFQQTAG
jgi:hypothetical protein